MTEEQFEAMVLNQLSGIRKRVKYIADSLDAMKIVQSMDDIKPNPRYDKRHAETGRPEVPPVWVDEAAEVTRDQAEALKDPPKTAEFTFGRPLKIVTAGGAIGKSFQAASGRPKDEPNEDTQTAAAADLIPSAVGRIDDVVAAIAAGDQADAVRMLWERGKIVAAKRAEYQRLTDQADAEMRAVLDFAERYSGNAGFRADVRQACGGKAGG